MKLRKASTWIYSFLACTIACALCGEEESHNKLESLQKECEHLAFLARQADRDARRISVHDRSDARGARRQAQRYTQEMRRVQRKIRLLEAQMEEGGADFDILSE
ncbi:MAG: hypothetical protein KDK78_01185 [Chlamydiia bacterium]|nr:hypothetical protein [Chlamydiia bacterium]